MKFLKSKIGKKICPFSQCTNVRRIGMKRSALRKEIDSFVLIGKRDAIFAQKGSARLINLCEMPKLQRKHTFLRLTIYIGAHFYKQNGRAWLHSTNPPRLVHLIWGWPYRRYSRLRICVGKKKKKIELPTWLLRLLFSFVTYRPGFIYFLCNEMPRYQWRRGRERPLSIVRL